MLFTGRLWCLIGLAVVILIAPDAAAQCEDCSTIEARISADFCAAVLDDQVTSYCQAVALLDELIVAELAQTDPCGSRVACANYLHDRLTTPLLLGAGVGNCELDRDRDGLPDLCELVSFANLLQEPDGDADNDGLSNLDECLGGTDPTVADTDGDGFSDGQEVAAGLDPLDPNDVLDDNDADGLSNGQELTLGSDPFAYDTDGDGLSDFAEWLGGTDPLGRPPSGSLPLTTKSSDS